MILGNKRALSVVPENVAVELDPAAVTIVLRGGPVRSAAAGQLLLRGNKHRELGLEVCRRSVAKLHRLVGCRYGAIPLWVQRSNASTQSDGHWPSHGIVPALTRSRIACAFARTSS